MAERVRTYSAATGRLQFGLAGFWVLLGLLATTTGDRLFTAFCLVSALGSGLNGANETWWRGSNRWFTPAVLLVAAVMAACAIVFVTRLVRDVRLQF